MRNSGTVMQITPFGNWPKATFLLRQMPRYVIASGLYHQNKWMDSLVKKVKGHLRSQDLPWKPLAESTVKAKGHDIILIDTTLYLQSIKKWRQGYTVTAGVPRGIYYRDGVEVSQIAAWHESPYNPNRRALWEPSMEELGGVDGIASSVAAGIAMRMAREGASILEVNYVKGLYTK